MKISQKVLQGELVRITTLDGLELHGILYEPQTKTDRVVVHINGWTGNFYENVFLDYIAQACVANNVSFLSFNTRGAGHIQEFLNKKNNTVEYVKIGGSLEKFEDCLVDIKAVLKFLQKRNYHDIILEGHSTGCQKAVYYMIVTNDPGVKGLVLLEPADDPSTIKRFLGERYKEAMNYAKKLIKEGASNNPMPDWVPFGVQLSAQKFLSLADPKSTEGQLFYVLGKGRDLEKIKIPMLLISADTSEYQNAKIMQDKITMYIKHCEAHIINNSGHWFFGKEEELGILILNWLKRLG